MDGEPTRRDLLRLGSAAGVAGSASRAGANAEIEAELREAIAKLEYLTPLDRIDPRTILDKSKSGAGKMSPEGLAQAGLSPDTWSLDVVPDPASDCSVEHPLSRALGNALDWNGLMKMAQSQAVRFMQACVCVNADDPFHMSLWEGVPLREIIWLARPKANVRRVYYQSYHAKDMPPFQASLALSQVLETPPGQTPVILAYKRNGQLLPASHGGPVRMIVPGAYGNKCIKWVRRVVLTNDYKANDSDAELNSDTETPLKTRARFINAPKEIPAGRPVALTGMAQVGISGLKKVQYCVHSRKEPWPADDPNWARADWRDAEILPPPSDWGGGLRGGKLPALTTRFEWPMRYTIVHWAAVLSGLPAGSYDMCCRTIDGNGIAQPMPRPLPRTGVSAIHRVTVVVKA